jgi:integrase
VLEVLYATAIRRNELLNLSVYDADLKDSVLYIRKAKGRVQRVVPLTRTAAGFVKEYLTGIRPRWAKKQPQQRRLFLINTGKPLNAGALAAQKNAWPAPARRFPRYDRHNVIMSTMCAPMTVPGKKTTLSSATNDDRLKSSAP